MATEAFEAIVEDFDFLEDWEDRYRYVIEQGKAMDALDAALKVPATKVDGCASQVWRLEPEEATAALEARLVDRMYVALLKLTDSPRAHGVVEALRD